MPPGGDEPIVSDPSARMVLVRLNVPGEGEVVTLESVLGKSDSHELTGYLILGTCGMPGGDDYLVAFARRHGKAVLAGGGQPKTVLKKGRPARDALERLLARDYTALGDFTRGTKELPHPLASFTVDVPPDPSDDSTPESEPSDPAEPNAYVEFVKYVIGTEDPRAEELLEVARGALDELRCTEPIECAEDPVAPAERADLDAAMAKIAELEATVKSGNKAYTQLDDKYQRKADAERKLSQLVTRLKKQLADAESEREAVRSEAAAAKSQLEAVAASAKRNGVSLDGRLAQLQSEKGRTEEHLRDARREIESREAALGRANEMVDALEEDKRRLEIQLANAAAEREELVSLGDIFADADPELSLLQLSAAMDTLGSLKAIVSRSVEAQRRMEAEAEAARIEIALERERAVVEQRRQVDSDEAWALREAERIESDLATWESALFAEGTPRHVLIDGHNLILRRYEPHMERTTRAWLERLVCAMNQDLGLDIRLVFDCPDRLDASEDAICVGVRRYFHRDADGGADAKIASLLREFAPTDKTLVASSDHRHVWANAEEARDEGYDVSLVSAELLHNYLIALDDRQRAQKKVLV